MNGVGRGRRGYEKFEEKRQKDGREKSRKKDGKEKLWEKEDGMEKDYGIDRVIKGNRRGEK